VSDGSPSATLALRDRRCGNGAPVGIDVAMRYGGIVSWNGPPAMAVVRVGTAREFMVGWFRAGALAGGWNKLLVLINPLSCLWCTLCHLEHNSPHVLEVIVTLCVCVCVCPRARARIYIYIQGYWKWWIQLNSKRRLNTSQTVGCGIPSSLLAVRVDVRGLRAKLSWIRLTFSSDTRKNSCAA